MAITVKELFSTRTISRGRAGYTERRYLATTDDKTGAWEAACLTQVISDAPSTDDGHPIDRAEITERRFTSVIVRVRWQSAGSGGLDSDGVSRSWSTAGNKERVTNALSVISSHIPAGETTTPDFGTSINVTANGVEGVEVVRPAFEFTETRRMLEADVTNAYRATIAGLTGTVNDAAFLGFNAGEVLFLGADASQAGSGEPYDITYRFRAIPNETGLSVDGITGIAKKGHEYVWSQYQEEDDGDFVTERARAAFVVQVYPDGDFSQIDLST